MTEGSSSIRTYTIIFVCLVVLMFATIGAALLDLGQLNLGVAMAIAVIKATLVILFFMHVKYSGRLVWAYSSGAFVWLAIALVFTFADYLTRGTVPRRLPSQPAASLFHEAKQLAQPAPFPGTDQLPNPVESTGVVPAPPLSTPGQPLRSP